MNLHGSSQTRFRDIKLGADIKTISVQRHVNVNQEAYGTDFYPHLLR